MKLIFRWSLIAILASVFLGKSAFAGLSEQDQVTLTHSLKTLALGWSQPDASSAFRIFKQGDYDSKEYDEFFSGFFQQQAFTDDLKVYFDFLCFEWPHKEANFKDIREKVNPGLAGALATSLLQMFEDYGMQLAEQFELKPKMARSFFNQLVFLNRFSQGKKYIDADLQKKYQDIWQQVPLVDASINNDQYQWWPLIKQQLAINYLDANEDNVPSELLGHYEGRRQQLLEKHGLLLLDNNQLLDNEVKQISQLVAKLPKQLLNIRFIHIQGQQSEVASNNGLGKKKLNNRMLPKFTSVNSGLLVKRPSANTITARQHFLQLLLAQLGKELAKKEAGSNGGNAKFGQTIVTDGELASAVSYLRPTEHYLMLYKIGKKGRLMLLSKY